MAKLEPHVCPVCSRNPESYYGRLVRPGVKEACPNHTPGVNEDGDPVEQEPVYLVPVRGTEPYRDARGFTSQEPMLGE